MAKSRNGHRFSSWHRLHEIQVVRNRWLAWAVISAVLVCATLVAYIQVSGIYFETAMRFDSSVFQNWSTFNNRYHGYSLKFPRSWGVEADVQDSMSFVNSLNPNEYFSVTAYGLDQENLIRTALFSTKEDTVKVDGISGIKLSQSRNQPENVVMVKDSNRLFVVRGKGGNFDKILSTFKFDQKIE